MNIIKNLNGRELLGNKLVKDMLFELCVYGKADDSMEFFNLFFNVGCVKINNWLIDIEMIDSEVKKYREMLNFGLRLSASNGRLDILKEIINNKATKKWIDVSCKDNEILRFSCVKGHLDTVKYLLEDDVLNKLVDIHALEDYAFIQACNKGKSNVVNYLVADFGIEKTVHIESYIMMNLPGSDMAKSVFSKRELNRELGVLLGEGVLNDCRRIVKKI